MVDAKKNRLTAEELAAMVGELTDEKRELLKLLLKEEGMDLAEEVILPYKRHVYGAGPAQYMPLSFSQHRMWFLDQFEPGSPFYNIPSAVHIHGQVNVDVLSQSLNEIVRRHEALRTTFATIGGEPVQVIQPALKLELPVIDISELAENARKSEAIRLANIEARLPFDLAAGPLIRVVLIRLAEDEHYLLWTMHHIISDGWSMGVFIYEFSTLYENYLAQRPSPLPELPIQYGDYSAWQRDSLQGEVLEGHVAYWLKQLGGELPVLDLPADRPRPPVQTSNGASYTAIFSRALTDGLKNLSQANGATLFMTLLASLQSLFYRYTGQTDITIGTPIANRGRPELETLIGIFINTLALRIDLAGKPTFRELLGRAREVALDGYAHQDAPFDYVVEKLQIERDLSHNPVFQVMLILQNAPQKIIRLAGITMETVELHTGTATFDLSVVLSEMPDGLHTTIEYNTDLFNDATIARMFGHWQTLLNEIVRNPDRSIAALPLLTDPEAHQILNEFNRGAQVEYPPSLVHQVIQRQALAQPDAIAVAWAGQALTYAELAARSDRLAVELNRLGVGPDTLVGVCIDRSPEMIIALLAILKAGGAYLPLDPNYPLDRLDFILQDSRARVIVTLERVLQNHLDLENLLIETGVDIVRLSAPETDAPTASSLSVPIDEAEATPADLDRLAYVIYTSGSTGRPKGVQITRRAMTNFVNWAINGYRFQPDDRVLQFATLNFDTAVEEIYPTLAVGASLVLRPEPLVGFSEFQTLVEENQITVLDLPTAYWHAWVSDLAITKKTIPACVRLVIVGGERALPEGYQTWEQVLNFAGLSSANRAAIRKPAWVNTYGPTETTVVCLTYEPPADWQEKLAPILPVGRPVANTSVLILDDNGQIVPVGVPGELYVGGLDVARGYLNRPELTAERFVENPFDQKGRAAPRERYYRTGDRVRFLADGNIEYMGRLDNQIKLRGFRIELGEIESVLADYPGVREAAVVFRSFGLESNSQNPSLSQGLVAFISGDVNRRTNIDRHTDGIQSDEQAVEAEDISAAGRIDVDDLRTYLQSKLPDYMLPVAIVVVAALPLTPNAKVDRKALASFPLDSADAQIAGQFSARGVQSNYVAPRNPIEHRLVALWENLLGVTQIGIQDNFFNLGGHSLLATQVISRIRDEFLVEIPLRVLFETPTVSGLAVEIEAALQAKGPQVDELDGLTGQATLARPTQPAIRPLLRDVATGLPHEPPVLSFAQQRLWFLDQFEPETANYNIPSALRLKGQLDVRALELSLTEIVRRHETLRTAFLTVDGRPLQEIHPPFPVLLHIEEIPGLAESELESKVTEIALSEARRPFDLTQAPLFRARLIRLSPEDHVALLTMHHIISDGWSSGVMIRELVALYTTLASGGSSAQAGLAELPIQYSDFAAWQRAWLEGAVLEEQMDYWKEKLQEQPSLLELPTDRPRPAVLTVNGGLVTFEVDAKLAGRLSEFSKSAGVTLYMLLLAVFKVLLARYSGQEDISVGTPIANRTRQDIEALIGFFVNTLVLRTDLSGSPDFQELLQRVKETALGAYAHQDIPFEMLVNEIQPERDTSRTPLFQVMFVMQNIPVEYIQLPGLTLSSIEVTTGAAMFDLTLTIDGNERGLDGAFEYNSDLFDEPTIRRMIGHYQTLLLDLIERPGQPVSQANLLTEAELAQVFTEWNRTTVDFPSDRCVHQLFEEQTQRSPDSLAIVFGDQRLTYAELNQKANQLANYLIELGVGPDQPVGLCIDRSLEMVIALFGILKAGGAYVSLDPAYPRERLAFMLDDMGASLVVTLERFTGLIPEFSGELVVVDRQWAEIAERGIADPAERATVDDLAYLIYTSGSTGRPKGVQVEHRSVTNFVVWSKKYYQVSASDRVLQFASLNFDTAVEEIYPTLLAGGTLVLRSDAVLTSFDEFYRQIVALDLTVLDLPTAYWHAWVAEMAHSKLAIPASVRLVIVGGEQAFLENYQAWLRLPGADRVRWVNTYGPSEATVVCLTYDPPADVIEKPLNVLPIGWPIDNAMAVVVDKNMQVVPVGVPGELLIGGVPLARGYQNRPQLTAEKFVKNPFSLPMLPNVVERFYHTGDRVRYLADGALDFLGRIDNQVKLRGMRIELGEIETILRQHPAVRDALVLARSEQRQAGSSAEAIPEQRIMQLVAYIIPSHPGEFDLDTLRAFLQEKLPVYMLPSAYVFLEAFPLTPNGKIDRKSLPNPAAEFADLGQAPGSGLAKETILPRTPEEEILAEIWKQLLGLNRISIDDNFFELGGDSILSIQATSRANQAGLQITPRQIFEAQTIAQLAAIAQNAAANGMTTPTAEQGLVEGASPLTPIEHWFFEQEMPDRAHFNQSLMFSVLQPLHPAVLAQTLAKLLEQHDALRSRFVQTPAGWEQMIVRPQGLENVPFEFIDLADLAPQEQKQTIEATAEQTQASLDILNGPVLRLVYFSLGADKPGRLLFVIHHLVVDGVSWRILLEDLQNIYTQLSQAPVDMLAEAVTELQLPPKTTAYPFWANRLVEYAQSEAALSELDYWQRIASLPFDHLILDDVGSGYPPERIQSRNVQSSSLVIRTALTTEETRLLLQEVPAVYGSEINDLLLAALVQAYGGWNQSRGGYPEAPGETSLLLAMEGHGREEIITGVDLSRTVGWFTSIYPVRLAIRDFDGPGEVIKKVKEGLRQVPHKGIGYGILRYLSADSAGLLANAETPEISFNYLGQIDRTLASGIFDSASESGGNPFDPASQRGHLIEIDGGVAGGQLGLSWSYSSNLFRAESIASLAERYMDALRGIIEHCLSPEAGGFTASDFPLAGIDQAGLDKVLSSFMNKKEIKTRKQSDK